MIIKRRRKEREALVAKLKQKESGNKEQKEGRGTGELKGEKE